MRAVFFRGGKFMRVLEVSTATDKYCIPYDSIMYVSTVGVLLCNGVFLKILESYEEIVKQLKEAA